MTQNSKKEAYRQLFETNLAELKRSYQIRLQEVDPLDREKLEKMLTDFSQELVTFQHRFIGSFPDGVDDPHIREFVIEEHPLLKIVNNEIAKIFVWIIGGAAGAAGFYRAFSMKKKELRKFFRKHPVWIIGGAAGVAGFYRAFSMGKKELRKFFRKHYIVQFDEEIAPSLRAWAHDKIETVQFDEETAPSFSVLAHDKKAE